MARKNISSASPYEKTIGFSRAVCVDDRILVSGTAPIADDGSTAHPGDAYLQAKRCLEIIKAAIEKAGGHLTDVVRTRIYLIDAALQDEVSRAHGEFFSDIRPAATMVVVKGLASDDWLVELEAEAVVSYGR
ncbi:MAG: RidA family protein [candidate division Zixibacteria bacterium]|nr:RidA family protein [candidate division Zixibacteria bacterium]